MRERTYSRIGALQFRQSGAHTLYNRTVNLLHVLRHSNCQLEHRTVSTETINNLLMESIQRERVQDAIE